MRRLLDIENPGRCYNFHRPEKLYGPIIYRLFHDLAIKSWMSRQILFALKTELLRLYSHVKANWEVTLNTIDRIFDDRENPFPLTFEEGMSELSFKLTGRSINSLPAFDAIKI